MNYIKLSIYLIFISSGIVGQVQDSTEKIREMPNFNYDEEAKSGFGVAVSPSSMRFAAKLGERQTKKLYVTNDTEKSYSFRLSFSNVEMDRNGVINPSLNGEGYGLKNWISASPNFLELAPREKAVINVSVEIPDDPNSLHAAWCIGMVDQVVERKEIVLEDANQMSMGVIPSFGFGVFFYQNPPELSVSEVEIKDFSFSYDDKHKYIHLLVENIGTGISRSKAYVELNELNTGYYEKLDLKVFNILPNRQREFTFQLPGKMPKGHYSIMGVLDFGSEEEIKAASKEIIIKWCY